VSEWLQAYVHRRRLFAGRQERLAGALAAVVPGETHPCEMDGCGASGTEMLIVFRELHWLCWIQHAVVP